MLNRQTFLAALILGCWGASPAAGQSTPVLDTIRAGDCDVTVNNVAIGTDPSTVKISVDSATASLNVKPKSTSPTQIVITLRTPLHVDSDVTVVIGQASATRRVAARDNAPTRCVGADRMPAQQTDDRKVFEASGFLGEVIDNFAVADSALSKDYVNTPTGMKARLTTGVEAQYRLGRDQSQVQLWLAGHVLHGMRSADANCDATKSVTACANDKGQLFIIEHASTIEAHIEARLELFRINSESEVPAKFYVFGRAGFLDLDGAPAVYDSTNVGIGLVAPKGVFRNSYVQVGKGVSRQFASDPRFGRFKVNGVLVFDLMPGLSTDGIFSRLGAGTRFFIAISIDRNHRFTDGTGPDAVQTYVGFDFDLRKMYSGL